MTSFFYRSVHGRILASTAFFIYINYIAQPVINLFYRERTSSGLFESEIRIKLWDIKEFQIILAM